ncbi:conserved protein of unknown function [Rhodovastum atsumiense]|uniref:YtxH domain-containing protein n=1 Tax=Rhodovastum atsumiense TaxID=504468 RepID=A0A5M6IZT5_9PROT|nr:hypothetical protein [Rhodovastum atsumiense]KAA5613781.1 hypothetical protein F1189_03120 [Rhodovastum atsumiense]CAH2601870.1 conserved protein of unknown function [Rhodovastum atsumiense]
MTDPHPQATAPGPDEAQGQPWPGGAYPPPPPPYGWYGPPPGQWHAPHGHPAGYPHWHPGTAPGWYPPPGYGPAPAVDPSRAGGPATPWHHGQHHDLLTGMLVGAAAAALLSNEAVQRTLIRSLVSAWAGVQGGLEEVKERFRDAEAELRQTAGMPPTDGTPPQR